MSATRTPVLGPEALMAIHTAQYKVTSSPASHDPTSSESGSLTVITGEELLATTISLPERLWGDGFFLRKTALSIDGSYGATKTWLLLELALSLAAGRDFLELSTGGPRRVLYIAGEGHKGLYKQRLEMLLEGPGAPLRDAMGRFGLIMADGLKLDREEGLERLAQVSEDFGADVLILDPVREMMSGDINSEQDWEPILTGLRHLYRKLGGGLILSHNWNKSQDRSTEHRFRGSVRPLDWCDARLTLERKQGDAEGVLVNAYFTKARYGQLPPNLELLFPQEAGWHRVQGLIGPGKDEWRAKMVRDVVAELQGETDDGKVQGREAILQALLERHGLKKRTAEGALRKAIDAGLVKADGPRNARVYWVEEEPADNGSSA